MRGQVCTTTRSKKKQNKLDKVQSKLPEFPKCSECDLEIVDTVRALNCDRCSKPSAWKCADCIGISPGTYDAVIADADAAKFLFWFCDSCKQSCHEEERDDRVLHTLQSLVDQVSTMEKKLDSKVDVERVDSLEARVMQIEEQLTHQERECYADDGRLNKLEKQITGIVAANQKDMVPPNAGADVDELRDRERRKNNIIVFNVGESTKDDSEERKQDDEAEVHNILFELNVASNLSNPVRLGPKRDDSQYPRPLRITVENETTKWNILREAKNLSKSGEEAYKKVYIKKDMTPTEREKDAELRKQLWEKRKQAEEAQDSSKWIIRKGRIVKLRMQH